MTRSFGLVFQRMFAVLAAATLIGQGCTKAPDAATLAASKRAEINIWAVVDDEDAYDDVFRAYRAQHPYVQINYRRLRLEEYESELVDALAEDRGPDIFMMHNTWIGKYLSKITSMPASTKVAVQTVAGGVNQKQQYQLVTQPSITLRQYKSDFPDAVIQDTVRLINVSPKADERKLEQRIVALPTFVDTLGMFVNKDLLNAAGIATIPTTWTEFQTVVPKLTKLDADGNIIQSGAAIGLDKNIERASDILSALMMQNGAEMAAEDGSPTFHVLPAALSGQREEPPAFQALSFYTDFANQSKEVYTWNDKMPNSFEAFIQGKTAFFFGYSYHLPLLRARAPKLNLAIAPLPQIEGNPKANLANYWVWGVSKKTKSPDVSWNLLNFMIKPEQMKKFLAKSKHPAAVKSLLPEQMEDEDIGAFASQVLTAKSWYRGNDPQTMEDAFGNMIELVAVEATDIPTAMRDALQKIQQTFR